MLNPSIKCVTPTLNQVMVNCFPCNPDCRPNDDTCSPSC